MPQYKRITSVLLAKGTNPETIRLLNQFASLRDVPVATATDDLLREVLPERIAKLEAPVKTNCPN